jgi:hypothetical protein
MPRDDAVPIDLAALGITPGMQPPAPPARATTTSDRPADIYTYMFGVFSATATLLARATSIRVADAIDAGFDVQTGDTYVGTQPTDIDEDFAINSPPLLDVTVTVPAGAAFLFVSSGRQLEPGQPRSGRRLQRDHRRDRPGSFIDLGHGLRGTSGVPTLTAARRSDRGATTSRVTLANARANSLSFPDSSASRALGRPPFKGGTLVPSNDLLFTLPTDGRRRLPAADASFPVGVPQDCTSFCRPGSSNRRRGEGHVRKQRARGHHALTGGAPRRLISS